MSKCLRDEKKSRSHIEYVSILLWKEKWEIIRKINEKFSTFLKREDIINVI